DEAVTVARLVRLEEGRGRKPHDEVAPTGRDVDAGGVADGAGGGGREGGAVDDERGDGDDRGDGRGVEAVGVDADEAVDGRKPQAARGVAPACGLVAAVTLGAEEYDAGERAAGQGRPKIGREDAGDAQVSVGPEVA